MLTSCRSEVPLPALPCSVTSLPASSRVTWNGRPESGCSRPDVARLIVRPPFRWPTLRSLSRSNATISSRSHHEAPDTPMLEMAKETVSPEITTLAPMAVDSGPHRYRTAVEAESHTSTPATPSVQVPVAVHVRRVPLLLAAEANDPNALE